VGHAISNGSPRRDTSRLRRGRPNSRVSRQSSPGTGERVRRPLVEPKRARRTALRQILMASAHVARPCGTRSANAWGVLEASSSVSTASCNGVVARSMHRGCSILTVHSFDTGEPPGVIARLAACAVFPFAMILCAWSKPAPRRGLEGGGPTGRTRVIERISKDSGRDAAASGSPRSRSIRRLGPEGEIVRDDHPCGTDAAAGGRGSWEATAQRSSPMLDE
jgi:hypothetical protein